MMRWQRIHSSTSIRTCCQRRGQQGRYRTLTTFLTHQMHTHRPLASSSLRLSLRLGQNSLTQSEAGGACIIAVVLDT